MNSKTVRDRIEMSASIGKLQVASIEVKDNLLRQFRHYMQHKPIRAPIERSNRIIANGVMRTKRRLKRTWMEAIKKDDP